MHALKEPMSIEEACESDDCMPGSEEETDHPFTIRHYPAMNVTVSMMYTGNMTLTATLANLKNIQHEPFMNLFRYINGENDRQERLTMSKPVVTMFIRDKTKSNIRSVGMLFYLFAENPPKPYDPRITITEMIPLKVYIRAFGGSDTSSAVLRRELETLYEDLVCADLVEKSDFNYPFLAEYAHPWASKQRHEVGVIAYD